MKLAVPVVQKAVAAKDYGRLVPVQKVRADGRKMTYWVLPEDARQQAMFDDETGGKESDSGHRGWHDSVQEGDMEYRIKPLLEELGRTVPHLKEKFAYKYDNYAFDSDTKDLDIKIDLEYAQYQKAVKQYPKDTDELIKEYRQKTDRLIAQVNNRKRSMLRLKVGSKVSFRGVPGVVSEFTERGYPVVKTDQGSYNSFYEEVAQSVINNWS